MILNLKIVFQFSQFTNLPCLILLSQTYSYYSKCSRHRPFFKTGKKNGHLPIICRLHYASIGIESPNNKLFLLQMLQWYESGKQNKKCPAWHSRDFFKMLSHHSPRSCLQLKHTHPHITTLSFSSSKLVL